MLFPRTLGCGRVAQCCNLCTSTIWEALSSGRGGFSSTKEGGKEAKGKERKCADGPGQVSCGAASQTLLTEVSIPFEWQEQIPGLGIAWVSGGSDQQRLLSHARAVLGSVAITALPCLLACFVSKRPCQGPGCSCCYQWLFQSREEAQGVPLAAEIGVSELRKEF